MYNKARLLTLDTINWKSAPTTIRHIAGKVNAQYESPFLCTETSTSAEK